MDSLKKGVQKIRAVVRWISGMSIPLHSAYTCFFWILSLFPCLLLLLGLLKYTDLGTAELMDFLEGFLPASLLPTAQMLVEASCRHSSGTVISVSALAALWSASRGMYGLINGLHAVYGIRQKAGYWRSRGISMFYTLCFLALLIVTLSVHLFGNAIVDYLWMTTHPLVMTVMDLIDLRSVLLLILQSILFSAMYAMIPGRQPLRRCIPGALTAALGWSLYSHLFSLYVEHFSHYTNIFGSLYALALGMLWLYFCIYILFGGCALNRWLAERSKPDF